MVIFTVFDIDKYKPSADLIYFNSLIFIIYEQKHSRNVLFYKSAVQSSFV